MLIGMRTGLSPMPKPLPTAVVGRLGAGGLPGPAVMTLAYGGFWGGALAALVREVSLKAGLGLGFVLWLVMQVVVLPFLGRGLFGVSVAPAIAAATLVLHLVYGGVLGVLIDRDGRFGSISEPSRLMEELHQLRFSSNANRKETLKKMRDDQTVEEACEIPEDQQEAIREEWRPLINAVEEVRKLPDGYEFQLPPEPRWVEEGGRLVASERECCSFFRLEVVSRANAGPVLLRFRSEAALERGLDSVIAEIFA